VLREWAEGVWLAEAPQRFYGLPVGARMTVVRLRGGDLLLHSPVSVDAALRDAIEGLGPVRHIVSPNKLHHFYLAQAHDAFPEAKLYAPPGLITKRPELHFDAELGDAAPEAWRRDLDQLIVRGSRILQEVVFLHGASRTLIVADICEHFGAHSPRLTRIAARLSRMYDRPRMPPDMQLTFRDRAATRASFERLLAWDFDRVILAHGRLLESGAKALFHREYAWALS
jgi:hypothetical protein